MASLIFCPNTSKRPPASASRPMCKAFKPLGLATLKVKCPHCGEVHEQGGA